MTAKEHLSRLKYLEMVIAQRSVFKNELLGFIKKGYGTKTKMLSLLAETSAVIDI